MVSHISIRESQESNTIENTVYMKNCSHGIVVDDDLVDINFQTERESTGNKSAEQIDAKESIIEQKQANEGGEEQTYDMKREPFKTKIEFISDKNTLTSGGLIASKVLK